MTTLLTVVGVAACAWTAVAVVVVVTLCRAAAAGDAQLARLNRDDELLDAVAHGGEIPDDELARALAAWARQT